MAIIVVPHTLGVCSFLEACFSLAAPPLMCVPSSCNEGSHVQHVVRLVGNRSVALPLRAAHPRGQWQVTKEHERVERSVALSAYVSSAPQENRKMLVRPRALGRDTQRLWGTSPRRWQRTSQTLSRHATDLGPSKSPGDIVWPAAAGLWVVYRAHRRFYVPNTVGSGVMIKS